MNPQKKEVSHSIIYMSCKAKLLGHISLNYTPIKLTW